jgi:lipopolysaccharide transport system permease protein
MIKQFKELYSYRELAFSLASREVKLRYKQTIMGVSWAVLQPVVMMVVFTIIFSKFIKVSSEGLPYPIFAYSALLPWTFFATSVSFGSESLIVNSNLVRKIYFPREVIPLASSIAAGVDFVVASVLFIAMMVYYHIPISHTLAFVTVLIPLHMLFTASVVLVLSATNVYFRDVRYAVPFVVQVWLYATPIIYSMKVVPERLRILYVAINPLAGIIDGFRSVILHQRPPTTAHLMVVAFVSLSLFFTAYVMFKRLERNFADVV